MNLKGKIKFAGLNNKGWYTICVAGGEKDTFVGFGHKNRTHELNGVVIEKGMLFEGQVDENNYNAFISGSVSKPAFTKGESKGSYNAIGQAMGGAVNRANALVAAGAIHPNSLVVNSLCQYMISEMCLHAAETKRARDLYNLAQVLDSTNFEEVYNVFTSFMAGNTQTTQPQPQPQQQVTQPTPQAQPAQQAQNLPDNFGVDSSGDGPPF